MGDFRFDVDVVLNLLQQGVDGTYGKVAKATEKMNKSFSGIKFPEKATAELEKVKAVEENLAKGIKLDGLRGNIDNINIFNKALAKSGIYIKKNGELWDMNNNKILSNNQAVKKLAKSTQSFNFSFLSLMFGGMALERIFGGAFKGIIGTYQKVADKNDEFKKKTNQLAGSFIFLKFALGKAFAESPIIQALLDTLTKALDDLGQFFIDNPGFATSITAVVGALALFGTGVFLAGTLEQLVMPGGTLDSLKAFDWDGLATKLKQFGSLIIIGFAIKEAFEIDDSFEAGKILQGITRILSTAALASGGYLLWKGGTGALPLIVLGFTLKAISEDEVKLFSSGLFKLFNLGVALMKTMGDMMWDTFSNSLIGQFFGLGDGTSEFNFGDKFKENFQFYNEQGKQWDEAITKFMNEVPDTISTDTLNTALVTTEEKFNNVYTAIDGVSTQYGLLTTGNENVSTSINSVLIPAFDSESSKVDSMIKKYKDLKKAKEEAAKAGTSTSPTNVIANAIAGTKYSTIR